MCVLCEGVFRMHSVAECVCCVKVCFPHANCVGVCCLGVVRIHSVAECV